MGSSVRNITAIAGKELRSYFSSPVAWVLMALFAALFGYFFYVYLKMFVAESLGGAMGQGPQTVNVNDRMIRPLLGNA
jgi:ABC-2 type transport system permease protein